MTFYDSNSGYVEMVKSWLDTLYIQFPMGFIPSISIYTIQMIKKAIKVAISGFVSQYISANGRYGGILPQLFPGLSHGFPLGKQWKSRHQFHTPKSLGSLWDDNSPQSSHPERCLKQRKVHPQLCYVAFSNSSYSVSPWFFGMGSELI